MDLTADHPTTAAIGDLIASDAFALPQTTVSTVAERFFGSSGLEAIAIVDNGEPVGLVTRTKLMFKLFRRFGFELYGKHPVIAVADARPLVVQDGERLDVVIDRALERGPQDIYDEIIVTDGAGVYRGLVSVKHLVVQQSNALAQSLLQRELASERARELERENAMRSQFMAHVTHELRSPVNVIIGLSELMRIALDNGSVEQVRNRLASIISNATNLRTIVTNVLDLSKLEANKMPVSVRWFDLLETVRDVAEATRVLVRAKTVAVSVNAPRGPLFIPSDPVKVRQILMNLAGNAAKFTDQGAVAFRVTLGEHAVGVAVEDSGTGIRQEHVDRLFQAFSQIEDAKTKRHEGTGLGLLIARSMARLLGGDLTVTSEFGKGSIFTIQLPRNAATEGGRHAAAEEEDHDHRR